MREKKRFNERTNIKSDDSVKKKYFLVFEGARTEEIYFDTVNSHKVDLGISPLIELIPLIRDYGEEGWSNPQKIVDRIVENVVESESGIMTYDILLNRIMDYIISTKNIKVKSHQKVIWQTLNWICENKLSKKSWEKIDDLNKATKNILKEITQLDYISDNLDYISDNIVDIIKSLSITYDSEIDKICLIVDRDKDSFSNSQYQYVLKICKDKKFDLYVTNPCFEFWLLLHFDDYTNLDQSKLLENCWETKKKKYTEVELCKRISFKKNRYKAEDIIQKIPRAIANEKKFCEDLDLLEHTVGSNIGKLLDKIINDR